MQTFWLQFGPYDSESVIPYKVPDLTTQNYLEWSFRLRTVLDSSGYKLWSIVSGDESAPESGDIAAFKQRQLDATCIILLCIPYHIQRYYGVDTKSDEDPKVVWDTICEQYRKSLCPWRIRRELYNVRLEDFDSVISYTDHIDSLIMKYNFAEETESPISQQEHTFLYLNGLPKSWRSVMLSWYLRDELRRDCYKLVSAMREWEAHLVMERDRNVKCFKCGQKGHRKRNCLR